MSHLIDSLLVLARGDERANALARDAVDLCAVLEEAADAVQRAGLGVRLESEDVAVVGDREALLRVLRILIDNAARHGEGKGLTVRLTAIAETARLVVEDEGPGFPEGSVGHVFDRFYRADPARRGEGAGVGLAIARSLVEALGGTITAANRTDGTVGAVLTVELPRIESL